MKRKVFSMLGLCVAGALIVASCKDVLDAIEIDLGVHTSDVTFTIPVIEEAGEAQLGGSSVYVNIDSLIRDKDSRLSSENIRSAVITNCTVTLLDGDSVNNFGALESCKVTLSTESLTTPVTIAEIKDNPDQEAHTMNIPVTGNDLSGYFKSKWFTYTVSGKARRATTKTLECKATISYNVKAGRKK